MKNKENIEYFNVYAAKRSKQRKRHSYYWKDISFFCDFFIAEDSSVLEIGCGCGELLGEIKAKKKVGIDFSEEMIHRAKEQFPEFVFYAMDAKNITLNETFDVIILSNTLCYIDDVQKVLSEVKKLCHSSTKIIINDFNYLWQPFLKFSEWIGLKTKTPQQNWLSSHDTQNLLFIEGFDVYRQSLRMLLPFNIPLLSCFFNKFVAKLPLIRHLCINIFTFAQLEPAAHNRKPYSVSVVVPARNESGNIEGAVKRIPAMGSSTEIIFVEGNSTDDTWQKVQDVCEKYKSERNIVIAQQEGKGKGDAVRKGFALAKGEILMILDADLTVPPEDLLKFYDAIASGRGEFINGSRLVYPMEKKAMRFLNVLGNKFFSIMFTWLLEQPFKDTLCGTKVLFKKDYEKLIANRKFFGEFDPFGDFDLLFGAYKLNLRITELPIRYRERTYGNTNISRFKHGFILMKMWFFAARKIKFI